MNISQIEALMEQARQNGDSLTEFLSSYQTLAANHATPLGLKQWALSDKPTMEDFNADNRIIDQQLSALAEGKADKAEVELALAKKVNVPTPLQSTDDLNNITTPGLYHCNTDTTAAQIANNPLPYSFALLVEIGASAQPVQTIKYYRDTNSIRTIIYTRSKYPGDWATEWIRLATTEPPIQNALIPASGVEVQSGYRRDFFKTQDQVTTVYFALKPISGGTINNNATIATLPVGYRPSGTIMFPATCNSGTSFSSAVIIVNASGTIGYAGPQISSGGYMTAIIQFVAA